MSQMKSLAKQTAIYGVSSILGKFLNWCLVPLYTYILTSSAEYGVVTNLYAWTALLLVILTYGMETGFFRFINKSDEDAQSVYSSVLWCIGLTSLLFALLVVLFSQKIADGLGYSEHPEYITLMAVIVSLDAFGSIPFAYLRYQNRPGRFAIIKLLMIVVNIFFNIFFLLVCPWLLENYPSSVSWFYVPDYGVGYVFVSNLFSTLFVTLMLMPEVLKSKFSINLSLLKRILNYSLPLLVLGIAGIMNQTIDKIIFPYLMPDRIEADEQLGIYGACFKVAMVMMVFTQAFRYAYEPFVFSQNKGEDKKKEYADAMKFFIIFSLLIILGMICFLDVLKYLIRSDYWEGLRVVPIILFSYLFQGIFFNLSLWYKLIDKTKFGAVFSMIGLLITLSINILFVPSHGYIASAMASFCCYLIIMLISYFIGQKYYKIDYDLKSLFLYLTITLLLLAVQYFSPLEGVWKYVQNVLIVALYVAIVLKRDLPIQSLPVVGRFFR